MAQSSDKNEDSEDRIEETEPRSGMSWFVFAFMAMCLVMTAAMAYFAWGVFERAV
ncbi:hypothetical protein [Aureimonas populi]|uniref:Uncharacterized protein n=1 Tax=Aureimonas populi TaxID=1701758 RepID=A0ABW5CJ15_9HYPH|nr:hypothetical protein [Aureimonas populi]